MASGQPQPDQDEVFKLKEAIRGALSQMHDRMLQVDNWLHADDDATPIIAEIADNFEDDHKYVIFPYAWVVHNRGVNQIMTAEVPEITFSYDSEDKKAHAGWDDDEKAVQRWAQGIIYQIVTTSTENPFVDLLQQQLGPGLGVLHYPIDYDAIAQPPDHGRGTPKEMEAWEMYERARGEKCPWRVTSLHPTWCFFDTAHDPPEFYIIERPINVSEAARLYPDLKMEPADVPEGDQVDTTLYTEYISRQWRGHWIGTIPITEGIGEDSDGVVPNDCGHTWVQLAWSGMGKKDYRGDWARRGVGMIQRLLSTFRDMTRDDNILALIKGSMIPKYVAEAADGDVESAKEEMQGFDPQSPQMGVVGPGRTPKPLAAPVIPPALIEQMRQNTQRVEELWGPGILSGATAGAGEPASKWAARTEAARGPFRTPKKNAEQAGAAMLDDMYWDIGHEPALSGGVTAVWYEGEGSRRQRHTATLSAKQWHPGGKFTFDFSPMSLQERAAKVEDAKSKQDAGWMSAETAAEKGGDVDDPKKEQMLRLKEMYLASPLALQKVDAMVTQAAQQRYGIQPPPPPAGPPGMPGMGMGQPGQPGMQPQQPVGPPMLGSPQEAQQQVEGMYNPQQPQPIPAGGFAPLRRNGFAAGGGA